MKREIVKERVYNAPIEKVWLAITSKEEMDQWYFKVSGFRPEVGFKFTFSGKGSSGEIMVHLCEVLEVVPERKLVHTWAYENLPGRSVLTWELEPEGDKTRVKLTHAGLDAFAENGKDFTSESFNGGWDHILGKSLDKYLG